MVKTSISEEEAGAGEPDGGSRHRGFRHGMYLDERCRVILERITDNRFWVSAQPDMTDQVIADRTRYLSGQRDLELMPETRQLLDNRGGKGEAPRDGWLRNIFVIDNLILPASARNRASSASRRRSMPKQL